MIREVLHFDAVYPDGLAEAKQQAWFKSREAELRAIQVEKRVSDTFEVVLTPERVTRLLKYFESYGKAGGQIADFGITEDLVDDEQTPAEWFTVYPKYGGDFYGPR